MRYIASFVLITFLSACTTYGPMSRQDAGTLIGAVSGTAIGAKIGGGTGRVIAIAAGSLMGAALGGYLGKSLDELDKQYHMQAMHRALNSQKTGHTTEWYNPQSGNTGYITTTASHTEANRYCREYTQTIVIANKVHEAYGIACYRPDGTWEIVK